MNPRYLLAGIVLAVLVVAAASAFRVGEAEQVIITQFGPSDRNTFPSS
jgi:regulator of protease activity HflC (stomatin/prohibitin superfamily)